MKRDDLHEAVLKKLDSLDLKLDEVRTKDIPALNTAVTGFRTEIESLKRSQTWSTRAYTILGGVIAVAVSKFTGGHH